MTARPSVDLSEVTAPEKAAVAAISTVDYVPLHNDRAIQQAYDFAADIESRDYHRLPDTVRRELVRDMEAKLLGMDMRALVSVAAEKAPGAMVEYQDDVLQTIFDHVESKELLPLFAAMVASDCPASAAFRQAFAHHYADCNAEGIAIARGFREDDDGYALGVGA